MSATTDHPYVFDVTADAFERDVLQQSLQIPVLVDFWAEWCEPCKQLGPLLEKIAVDHHGAFLLAKVDVEKEQQLAAAFQVRSVPTVFLVKGGQLVDGFPGVLSETQLREFLKHHGIEPAAAPVEEPVAELVSDIDPQAEVARLRAEIVAAPEQDALKLDLALALLLTGGTAEAEQLLDGLPANLATDDRAQRARARLGFAALLKDAPPADTLEAVVSGNPDDLHARHLLGAHRLVSGDAEAGLGHFLEMLRRDRNYHEGLPRKALIDAFRVVEDTDLIGTYRRRMASLLF